MDFLSELRVTMGTKRAPDSNTTVKYLGAAPAGSRLKNKPQVRCEAYSIEEWTGWDLNPRPLPCQDSDLPADLPARGPFDARPFIKVLSLGRSTPPYAATGR